MVIVLTGGSHVEVTPRGGAVQVPVTRIMLVAPGTVEIVAVVVTSRLCDVLVSVAVNVGTWLHVTDMLVKVSKSATQNVLEGRDPEAPGKRDYSSWIVAGVKLKKSKERVKKKVGQRQWW